MATGTYGTIRPADVSPEDVEIILNYTPSRDETENFIAVYYYDIITVEIDHTKAQNKKKTNT